MTAMRWLFIVSALVCAPVSAAAQSHDGVDFQSFETTLAPDFQAHTVTGRTRLVVTAERDAVRDFAITANALRLDWIDGATRTVSENKREWRFALPKALRRGQTAAIEVHFSGKPARGMTFDDGIVYTSYFACDWMICPQDRPGDKAAFTLALDLPPGMTSLGPGTMTRAAAAVAGRERHVWRETRPYPTFVFGFAAGRFTSVFLPAPGPTLAVLAQPGAADSDRIAALFGTTAEMLGFFQDKAGVLFPHPRYTQLLVRGIEAQEASHFSIIGTQMIEPILANAQEDWVVAHELAHQWWGNLVTCADWREFWLNEGVVTFLTAAWKEYKHGRPAYDREMELARKRLQAARDAGFDKPLAWDGQYPDLRTRRAVQYSKGALFLNALRTELGDTAFWAGLKLFTQRHAGGTVVSRDFQNAMETASGRDLSALFREWVTG